MRHKLHGFYFYFNDLIKLQENIIIWKTKIGQTLPLQDL